MNSERISGQNGETAEANEPQHLQMPALAHSSSIQDKPEQGLDENSSLPVDCPSRAWYVATNSLTQNLQPEPNPALPNTEMHNHQDFIPTYVPRFQCNNPYTLPHQQCYLYDQYNQPVFPGGSGTSTLWHAPPPQMRTGVPPLGTPNTLTMQGYVDTNQAVHQEQDASFHDASHHVPFQAYVATVGPAEVVNPGPSRGSAGINQTLSLQHQASGNNHLNGGPSLAGAFCHQANPGSIGIETPGDRRRTDVEFNAQTILSEAQETARFYEKEEWDRTNGWSPLERVTMLDKNALDKLVPGGSATRKSGACRKITTIYVVLLHHIPIHDPRRAEDGSGPTTAGPTPCFRTKGDILYVIQGEGRCRNAGHQPPLITHKWEGKIALCGFRKENGRSIARVIRGEQDVGAMYKTIARVFRTQQPAEQR